MNSLVPRRFAAQVAAFAGFMAIPFFAWSHAGLVKSEPGRRAVLSTSPQQMRLCFNENVEPKFSSVSVAGEGDAAVILGALTTDVADPKCIVAPITATLSPGRYTVKYKVLSVDGHVVDYGFQFTLKSP